MFVYPSMYYCGSPASYPTVGRRVNLTDPESLRSGRIGRRSCLFSAIETHRRSERADLLRGL